MNLESAWGHLRYEDRNRILWVDAVCINQIDEREKIHQIRLMGRIYRQAVQVCVWLGAPADNSDAAMDLLEVYDVASRYERMLLIEDRTDLVSHWKALFHLTGRPWFTRRWIVQEVALADKITIYCGHRSTTWQCFSNTIYCLDCGIRKYVTNASHQEPVYGLFKHWRFSDDE